MHAWNTRHEQSMSAPFAEPHSHTQQQHALRWPSGCLPSLHRRPLHGPENCEENSPPLMRVLKYCKLQRALQLQLQSSQGFPPFSTFSVAQDVQQPGSLKHVSLPWTRSKTTLHDVTAATSRLWSKQGAGAYRTGELYYSSWT